MFDHTLLHETYGVLLARKNLDPGGLRIKGYERLGFNHTAVSDPFVKIIVMGFKKRLKRKITMTALQRAITRKNCH